MTRRPFKFLVSVKAKLLAGFLAMTLLLAGLGGYALISIGGAGDVVKDTFDRPLMAVNFARSASRTFAALEIETLRLTDPEDPYAEFDWLSEEFVEDLRIARERSISPRAEDYFETVEQDFAEWKTAERIMLGTGLDRTNAAELGTLIEDNLDIIVELQTNESFRNRESAIGTMARIKRLNAYAVAAALILTLTLTAWIALTIVRPLNAAARAASQISAGRLDAVIPKGGEDETGQLLRTMRSMQTNIKSRMEKEQDLRTLAQHRLADSLENSKDAVLLTDVEGKIIVANPSMGTLFPDMIEGGSPESLLGQVCGTLFAADGIPLHIVQTGPQMSNEFQMTDGRWVRVNASVTREGGRLFIWSDISESKAQAERLRKARDAAEAASRAKTLFLAAMSHELNTPLNAIIGLSDVMKLQQSRRGGDSSQADMAGLISQSGEHMAQIVSDVLEIASDETDPIDLELLEPVNIGTIVDRAVASIQDLAKTSEVHLNWTKPRAALLVSGDSADLQTLAAKLLENAVKFNRAGGVVKAQIVRMADEEVRLDIIDNGIGIDPEDFERILEPFIQVDEGYSRAVDGTGLGLCVADRIARRHGSALQIRSVLGKGSVFSLVLRRVQSGRDVQTADTQTQDLFSHGSERVNA